DHLLRLRRQTSIGDVLLCLDRNLARDVCAPEPHAQKVVVLRSPLPQPLAPRVATVEQALQWRLRLVTRVELVAHRLFEGPLELAQGSAVVSCQLSALAIRLRAPEELLNNGN